MDLSTLVPDSIDNAAKNLTDKPTQQIGETLGDIFYLVFGGLGQMAKKKKLRYACDLERYKRELYEKLEKIPKENRIEPDMQTVGPALEASKFCVEKNEIRHMFVNLISATMDSKKSQEVHPSFSDIIRQMTPLDAQNLLLFKKDNTLPLAQYRLKEKNLSGFKTIKENVFLENPAILDIDKQAISIAALDRLGLVDIEMDMYVVGYGKYEKFYQENTFKQYSETYKTRPHFDSFEIHRESVTLTPLGKSFLSVCLTD